MVQVRIAMLRPFTRTEYTKTRFQGVHKPCISLHVSGCSERRKGDAQPHLNQQSHNEDGDLCCQILVLTTP